MEAMGGDLREMQRVPLAPTQVAALREAGAVVQNETGAFLARPGQPIDRFTYVEEGEIEVVNAFTGGRLNPSTLGPRQFMAEIPLLSGGNWSMLMRAARPTRVIEVPRREVLRLMSEIPEMSDIIITVLSARRRRHLESLVGDRFGHGPIGFGRDTCLIRWRSRCGKTVPIRLLNGRHLLKRRCDRVEFLIGDHGRWDGGAQSRKIR
jgi:hypothetical protein